MFSKIFDSLKLLAFHKKIFSRILSLTGLGRLAFWYSIVVKRLSTFYGSYSQRAVEYPWVLRQLKLLKPGALILDVGCAESMLSHELVARKFRVVGIDIRDYPFKNKSMHFMKKNVLNTGFPDGIFDAVILVSTIEHIGLKAYGQKIIDDEGDVKTIKELHRILKPSGYLIMTTPFIGDQPFRITNFERNYNRHRLMELTKNFETIIEDYFYPEPRGRRLKWTKLNKEQAGKRFFINSGVACLVLRKTY